MVSLVSFLDENARRQPDHLACVVGDDSLSYAELRVPPAGSPARRAGFPATSGYG
jgi:non-ribosomal peptide synthetase component E (peptide arylation enzyme)